jgi:histone H3/H4
MAKTVKTPKNDTIYFLKNSAVKKLANVGEARVASDFYDVLNNKVGKLIIKAVKSAKSAGRSTIRPTDLEDKGD